MADARASLAARWWSSSPDGLARVEGGRIVQANPRLEGWLEGSGEGRLLAEIVAWDDATGTALTAGEASSARGRLREGAARPWVEVQRLDVEDGAWLATLRDVTHEHILEEKLRLQNHALEESLNGYDIVDGEGRIVYANRAYVEMWGYDHVDEVIGMSAAEHCADPETPGRIIDALQNEGRVTLEFEGRRKDGGTFDVLMSAQMAEDAAGRPVFIGTSLDVSELRRLRRGVAHAQKMEAVGRLAASVAHDFNNMLSPILGYAELLLDDDGLDEGQREGLDHILTAAERARDITGQLLAIARSKPVSPRPTELTAAVREAESLLRHTLREDIALVIHDGDAACRVVVDPAQLQRILLNLVHNAMDAMPEGGTITVEVGQRTITAEADGLDPDVAPGRYGELVVTDTGEGMDRATLARVFEAFFTTKAANGHGLGLASVHGIVKQHGGHIFVYSEPGHGTVFKVYLPLTDQEITEAPRPRPPSGAARGKRVLLVEDDEQVRTVAERILQGGGLVVTAAASGEEALASVDRLGPPDLLLTDVVMRDVNGRQVAEELKRRKADLPVVFMSGYTENVIVHHGALDRDVDLVEKPFSATELLDRVLARL